MAPATRRIQSARDGIAQSLRAAVVAALLRMLEEPPDEVAPRVPGLLADLGGRYPPLQRRAIDGGALEALADILHLVEPCDELLVWRTTAGAPLSCSYVQAPQVPSVPRV